MGAGGIVRKSEESEIEAALDLLVSRSLPLRPRAIAVWHHATCLAVALRAHSCTRSSRSKPSDSFSTVRFLGRQVSFMISFLLFACMHNVELLCV